MCTIRLLQGEALQPFSPQSTYLSIITTGDRYAVAVKSWLCLEVAPVWECSVQAVMLHCPHCTV